jgi:16S rRNA processing protein RimM
MTSSDENDRDDLVIVARAVRTRGLKGELVADILTDFPERFENISELAGVAPDGTRKQLELEKFWFQNDRVILKFADHDSVESAKTLVGFDFGVPEAERVELSEGEFYDWELEGCSVETNSGLVVGRVREVMRTGGVELLVVDGEKQEVLIPLAATIVVEIDVENRKIVVDPPEGLLEL